MARSEGRGRDELHGSVVAGMRETEHLGVKLEAIRGSKRITRRVKTVAHDRVSDGQHVHAQLMRPTGEGDKLDARDAAFTPEHVPARLCGSSALEIDSLARPYQTAGC